MSCSAFRATNAYVRPWASLNSTSYTPGAQLSTTVPTWPRTKPCSGRSSRRATTECRLISGMLCLSLQYITSRQPRQVFAVANDPGAADWYFSVTPLELEIDGKATPVRSRRARQRFTIPGCVDQRLSQCFRVPFRDAKRGKDARLVTPSRVLKVQAVGRQFLDIDNGPLPVR